MKNGWITYPAITGWVVVKHAYSTWRPVSSTSGACPGIALASYLYQWPGRRQRVDPHQVWERDSSIHLRPELLFRMILTG